MRELLEPGGWIELVDGWDPNPLTTRAALVAELPLRQETVINAGQRHLTPRLTSWHGDPEAVYRYSGRVFAPEPWTPALAAILARLRDEVHPGLNACLANYYRDGQDAMGAHSDDEPELGPDAPRDVIIASVSLGDVRRFALQPKQKSRRSERSRVAGRTLDADGRRRSEEEADASATRAERGHRSDARVAGRSHPERSGRPERLGTRPPTAGGSR
ncbi:MAG: alpha-ketoglutarate-dependent dioxygenase AlkB [Myxococcota bacterium]